MLENWKAIVVFEPGLITNSVFLYRDRERGVREYRTGQDEIKAVKEGERLNSDELRFALLDEDEMQALIAAFDKFGVKRPEASFTEGKLLATEKHLEDMRMIVGHVKKIPLERKDNA